MESRRIDLVAAGPAPRDPYDPIAAAWALASAAHAAGGSVRVLFPKGTLGGPDPEGVTGVPIGYPIRRPGAALEAADFARAAGRMLQEDTELVLRDPAGLGALGVPGRPGRRARVVAFVRRLEVEAIDSEGPGPVGGLGDRIDRWRDRRAIRRLEREALTEADTLVVERPEIGEALRRTHRIEADRLRTVPPVVPRLPEPPSREKARAALGIPPDVPTIVAPAATERPEDARLDLVREGFRRIRPLFPGVRLIVAGLDSPSDPGLVAVPARDPATFSSCFAAADIALLVPRSTGFDPGLIFAQVGGCAVVATESATLPDRARSAVHTPPSDDPGDIASTLAELAADPAAIRASVSDGRAYATRFDPARVLEAVAPSGRSR